MWPRTGETWRVLQNRCRTVPPSLPSSSLPTGSGSFYTTNSKPCRLQNDAPIQLNSIVHNLKGNVHIFLYIYYCPQQVYSFLSRPNEACWCPRVCTVRMYVYRWIMHLFLLISQRSTHTGMHVSPACQLLVPSTQLPHFRLACRAPPSLCRQFDWNS